MSAQKAVVTGNNVENIDWSKVLDIWLAPHPHFGGAGPHRYTDGPYCRYCLRPKDFNPAQFEEA